MVFMYFMHALPEKFQMVTWYYLVLHLCLVDLTELSNMHVFQKYSTAYFRY